MGKLNLFFYIPPAFFLKGPRSLGLFFEEGSQVLSSRNKALSASSKEEVLDQAARDHDDDETLPHYIPSAIF